MAKTWQQRITDTLNFIQNWKTGSNAQYAYELANFIRDANVDKALKATSEEMSLGFYNPFTRTQQIRDYRQMRRAIILLRIQVLGHNANTATTQTERLTNLQLAPQLNTYLGQAYQLTSAQLEAPWTQLNTTPGTFLANHYISVTAGSAHGNLPYFFSFEPAKNRYTLEPAVGNAARVSKRVTVYHVSVTKYQIVQNDLGNIDAPEADRAQLVVTTQLTGCSYMYQVNNNSLRAAHIYAAGAIEATAMCKKLRDEGGFKNDNGGPLKVYGAQGGTTDTNGYKHQGTYTYILARYLASSWQVHVQQYQRGYNWGQIRHLRAYP
jgi:hypothetical protein